MFVVPARRNRHDHHEGRARATCPPAAPRRSSGNWGMDSDIMKPWPLTGQALAMTSGLADRRH
jgi:hypothetical protein